MKMTKLMAAAAVVSSAAFLAACGGDTAEGTTPSPVTYTVACANGNQTSSVSATDYSVCGALPTESLSVSWASATGTSGTLSGLPSVTGDTFAQTTFTATPTTGSAVNVVASVDAAGNSATLNSASNLASSTQYTLAGTLSVSGYKPTPASLVFTTPAVSCAAPAMANSLGNCVSPPYGDKSVYNATTGTGDNIWNAVMKAWVARQGVIVATANEITCANIGDACWKAKVADQTIKLVDTGMEVPGSKTSDGQYVYEATVFAYYKKYFQALSFMVWNARTLYANRDNFDVSTNPGTEGGGSGVEFVHVKGVSDELKIWAPNANGDCYKIYHNSSYGTLPKEDSTNCN